MNILNTKQATPTAQGVPKEWLKCTLSIRHIQNTLGDVQTL